MFRALQNTDSQDNELRIISFHSVSPPPASSTGSASSSKQRQKEHFHHLAYLKLALIVCHFQLCSSPPFVPVGTPPHDTAISFTCQ